MNDIFGKALEVAYQAIWSCYEKGDLDYGHITGENDEEFALRLMNMIDDYLPNRKKEY